MNIDWHARFTQQAVWTKSLRTYLLKEIDLQSYTSILEIGCGTGAVLSDFASADNISLHGLDINYQYCAIATRSSRSSIIVNADLYTTPYPAGSFDLVFCHYLFLWLAFPGLAMEEVFRILKPSGGFLIFAEPDYESRIDFPSEFASLGKEQTKSLVKQGVNPRIGRSLPSLASQAGFIECKYGISGYETFAGELPMWWESEWQTIRYDLAETLLSNELDVLMEKDRKSWLNGSRVLWIPTFYLSCRKPPE